MSDSTLLNRLEGLDARYEEIGTLITDPSVIADQRRYVKLTKEYKHLEDLLNAANKYKKLLADIEDAKFLIANESDPDIREMAKEELDANEPQIPKMEEEIKLLLIPEDPEDSKMWCSNFVAEPVAMKLPFSLAIWHACTPATANRKAGRCKCRAAAKAQQVASKK